MTYIGLGIVKKKMTLVLVPIPLLQLPKKNSLLTFVFVFGVVFGVDDR